MSEGFSRTPRQLEALQVLGSEATHILLDGGSRSGKTFIWLDLMAFRAMRVPKSRHAILRFRFNHVKASIVHDTFPKMMSLCYPGAQYRIDRTDWYVEFPNRSQIWFGGLDDKERTEKILGQEYATIALNEVSQIPYASRNLAVTRLAQKCTYRGDDGRDKALRLKMYYDCNPPNKGHWVYQLFRQKIDPETREPLKDAAQYVSVKMNPSDNAANLPAEYLRNLDALPARMRLRFRDGEYTDAAPGALWTLEMIERYRESELPDMQRIVVAVDPSGSGDEDNSGNDDIGIIVAGLGTDGNGYVLEDLTLKAGPDRWGSVAVSAFDRHDADVIVGETNFGGEMVSFVVSTAAAKREGKKPSFKKLTASRGKVVRAEPISALTEQGKIRFGGSFPQLEDELCSFTTTGYMGSLSPNRADAFIWAMSELFPGLVKGPAKPKAPAKPRAPQPAGAWMR
jgi:hypothetical protein